MSEKRSVATEDITMAGFGGQPNEACYTVGLLGSTPLETRPDLDNLCIRLWKTSESKPAFAGLKLPRTQDRMRVRLCKIMNDL